MRIKHVIGLVLPVHVAFEVVGWHSFKHHATLLTEVGESIKTTQAILGHSDLNTTLNIYSHPIPESQRRRCLCWIS
jgi:site-specific recombinase XerD